MASTSVNMVSVATHFEHSAQSGEDTAMKMVMAVIKPFTLDRVRAALGEVRVEGVTASEVRGYGRQRGQTEIYRGAEYKVEFLPKVELKVVVDDSMLDRVVEAIKTSAHTGKIGDGKIFVLDVAEAIRIRTGEMGSDAI